MNQTRSEGMLTALLLGLLVVFGGTFVCAVLLWKQVLSAQLGSIAVYACLSAGCLTASLWGARKAASRKLLFGLCPALFLLGCLFLLALSWKGQMIQPASAAIVSLICLCSAVLGALSGTLLRTKRK